ncbi:MAG: hypothetical protein GF344_11050 [Chitinivibrionales bacterium]|nr:hypothetical protein [Chitinivibrionales bacterium]MBD3357340.1 hypothetical protein [Chitinivibrionales bacterium]
MKRAQTLQFRDYLQGLSPDTLFEYLVEEGGERRRIVSKSLVEEIARDFTSEEALARRVENLSEEARRVCAMTYLLGAGGMVAHGLDSIYRELVDSFLVYAARDRNDGRHLIGFADLVTPLRKLLAPSLVRRVEGQNASVSSFAVNHRALNDFVIIATAALEDRLRKNRNGNLSKGGLSGPAKLMSVRGGRRQPHSLCGLPQAVSLLLAYGVERGILSESPECYGTTHARLASWVARSSAELYDDLADFVIERTGGWRTSFFEEMQAVAGDDWLSCEAFPPTCLQPAATALRCLDYIRMIDAVEVNGRIVWRLRTQEAEKDVQPGAVTVMPDFSVIIAREASPSELYAFSWLGTLGSFDQIYKGKVDRAAVNNALSRGVESATLQELLRRWHAPENVVATVAEWIRGYDRLCVRSGDFVISYDEKVTKQLVSYEPIRAVAEPLGADAVFVIREGMREKAWRVLAEMGFDPRSPRSEGEANEVEKEGAAEREEKLEPLFELDASSDTEVSRIRHGKYSADLKELELNEMLHVIEYAILMGYELRFEYAGSPHVRRGRYSVKPVAVDTSDAMCLEAIWEKTRRRKKFFVRKIEKIGVVTA